MDWQLAIVALAALLAGAYAARAVWMQFERPQDEPEGCDNCPANAPEPGLRIIDSD